MILQKKSDLVKYSFVHISLYYVFYAIDMFARTLNEK